MSLLIKQIPINTLKLLERNPRKITKDQMDKLCKSIQNDPNFLNSRPVLVNHKDGKLNVYAGNQRVRAAQKLKWETIPCIVEDDLPDDLMKERIIKDNKTYGEFDFDMLANEWDTNLLLESGFTETEIPDFDIEDLGSTEEDNEVLEPAKDEDAITKLGDIYELDGCHIVICGDSTCPDNILPILQKHNPILMVTDPPYGIKMDKGFSGSGGFAGKGNPIKRREYKDTWDDERPTKETFQKLISICKNSIIFGGNFFADILPKSTHWIVWDKKNTMPSFGDCELAWTNFNRKSVKKYEVEWNGLIGKEKERFHPTQKPLKLINEIISNYIEENQNVYDPFLGSGTTLIAAEQLKRKCIGVELSPAYCDIIVNRWINWRKKHGLEHNFKRNGIAMQELIDVKT